MEREHPSEALIDRQLCWELLSFPDTDAGNAEAFALLHGHRFRFDHSKERWLVWNERYWEADVDNEAERAALDTARWRRWAVRLALASHSRAAFLRFKWAFDSESVQRVKATLESAKSIGSLATTTGEYDGDPFLLTVGDGTLELRVGKLCPARPEDLITRATDIPYNPDASCPRWLDFLAEVFAGDMELISFIWRAVGYTLTGDTREQCLFILYGTGANGKTTFLQTVRKILGTHALTTPFSTFMIQRYPGAPRNDLAALHGARMAIASEAGQQASFDEPVIKHVTGGDRIACRFLYGEFFEYEPRFKVWLATNYKPTIQGTDEAIWRRIRLVPFNQQFKGDKRDLRLGEKLEGELPGILAWAVRGCLAWQQEGLGRPRTVVEATREYRAESDQVGRFLRERCITGPDYSTPGRNLYAAYIRWCQEQGEKPETNVAFAGHIARQGLGKKRTRRGYIYEGLGLLAEGNLGPLSRRGG